MFSAALSVPVPFPIPDLPVRKCGALCCPDFPPSGYPESDKTSLLLLDTNIVIQAPAMTFKMGGTEQRF